MIKKLASTVFLALMAFSGVGLAQTVANRPAPNCRQPFALTAAGNVQFDNRPTFNGISGDIGGCDTWVLEFHTYGFSADSVEVQAAPDATASGSGTAGTFAGWVAAGGTILSGTFPSTATTQAHIAFTGYFPWTRIILNSKTGTGNVTGILYGWISNPDVANVSVGDVTVSGGNEAASATAAAVPAKADYQGVKVGSNLVGVTGTDEGSSVYAMNAHITGSVLPTGAATAAKQPALGTAGSASADVITIQGVTSMTPVLTTLSGTNNINNISGTISLPTGAATATNLTGGGQKTQIVDGSGNVIASTSNAINAYITGGVSPGVAIASTTSGQLVTPAGCAVTTDAPSETTAKTYMLSCDPNGQIRTVGPADTINTTPPAYANADPVSKFEYALNGQLVVFPYQNPAYTVNGTATSAITNTTSTETIAAAGGSLRNYVMHCSVSNSHASVDTLVKILDGTTVIGEQMAAHGSGFELNFGTPARGTANTAVNIQPVTTGASIIGICNGFKGL